MCVVVCTHRRIKTRHRKKGKEPMPASMDDGQGELDGAYLVLDSDESVDLVWLAGKIVVHMLDVLSEARSHTMHISMYHLEHSSLDCRDWLLMLIPVLLWCSE